METDPRIWIAALRSTHQRLAALVDGITPAELAKPSMCAKWNVAQVLSHLGSGAEIGLASLTGEAIVNEDVWARWNALAPADAAVAFVEADEHLVAWWERLGDDELESMQVQLPFLPVPIGAVAAIGFRLSEVALHAWDVFAAGRADVELATDAAGLLIDRLPAMVSMLGGFTSRDTRPAKDTTIVVLTSAPPRTFELELGDEAALRSEPDTASGVGQLRLPSEALIRLVAGRLPSTRTNGAEISGRLTLDDLRRAFPGF